MRNVGCQPPWRRFTVDELPVCDSLALLNLYAYEYERIASMVRSEILEDTNCLIPCTFMEYKVCKYSLINKLITTTVDYAMMIENTDSSNSNRDAKCQNRTIASICQ